MRYPNLRYGNPTEFTYYAMGAPRPTLARILRRHERTVRTDYWAAREFPGGFQSFCDYATSRPTYATGKWAWDRCGRATT